MDKTINITVKDKIATAPKDAVYICGNSDFVINFAFDSEWDEYDTKTARFIHDGAYTDVVFTGNQCDMPIISNTYNIKVGVFAGNLHTTTQAYIPAKKSILCEGGSPADPPDDVYNQIMERLNEIGTTDPEAIAAAVADYISEHPITETDPTVPAWAKSKEKPEYTAKEVGAIAETELQTAINTALAQAKESGEFDGADGTPGKDGTDGKDGADGKDGVSVTHSWNGTVLSVTSASGTSSADLKGDKGEKGDKGDTGATGAQGPQGETGATGPAGADGKSAYEYAVEGGYTGTEAEFAQKLAQEKYASPNALTFTGAVTGSYDGSEALTVEIPSGGGGGGSGSEYVEVFSTKIEEEIATFEHVFTAEEVAILADAKRIYVRIHIKVPSNASEDANGTCIFYLRGYSSKGTTIPYSIILGNGVTCIPKANVSYQTYSNVHYTMDITKFYHWGELFQVVAFQNATPGIKSTYARGNEIPFSEYKTTGYKTSFYATASSAFGVDSIFTIYVLR